jgi:uncharacterized protein (TIGR02145 family)
MKETGTVHWLSPNTGATNESGFSALPDSHRNNNTGYFHYIITFGNWWSSTESSAYNAWNWQLTIVVPAFTGTTSASSSGSVFDMLRVGNKHLHLP